jgi:uncharacterized protein (TIGR00369 family)
MEGLRKPGVRTAMPSGFREHLGIKIVERDRERVVGELLADERHMNGYGRVHGGVLMAFADELGGYGTAINLTDGAATTTLESKTNFFRAGQAGVLRGESIPLHRGRSTMVWQTTIRNADGTMVAIITQTQIMLRKSA